MEDLGDALVLEWPFQTLHVIDNVIFSRCSTDLFHGSLEVHDADELIFVEPISVSLSFPPTALPYTGAGI